MQLTSIQRLRALAAITVVIGHAQTEAVVAAAKGSGAFAPSSLLPWGAGVDLFFVISGFIMVVASDRFFGQSGASGVFASRRLKRIVPLYWLFTTLYVLIQFATHKPVGGLDLLASYLFWPRDIFGDGIARPIFTLGWTLDYEMFFYALFAVAVRWPERRAVAIVAGTLSVGVAIGQLWHLPAGPLAFWTQPIVLEFVFGMGIGLLWRDGLRLPSPARGAIAAAAIALLALDLMHSAQRPSTWITPTDFARVAAWGLPAAMLAAAAALGRPRPDRARGLDLVALGDVSYALYLVHPFVVGTLVRGWTVAGLAGRVGYWPFVAASLAVSIAAAFATRRWFETPVARRLARRKPEREAPSAARPNVLAS